MMKTNKYKQIEKKGRKKIVIKSIKGQNLNLREVEDIQNGAIQNIVPMEVGTKRNGFVLTYDVTDYISVEQYIHMVISRRKFAELLLQILHMVEDMTSSYYNPQNLLLELDKVYFSPNTNKVMYIFVPVLYYECSVTVKDFLIQLIYSATFDSAEDTSYVEKCLDILQRNMNFSVVELEQFLQTLEADIEEPPSERPRVIPPVAVCRDESERKSVASSSNRTSGMTETVSDIRSTDTVLLGEEAKAYLKMVRTGQKFYLNDEETYIGKRQCHVAITDNPAISKRHAVIRKMEGKFYLVDLNSTNGSRVDGVRIAPEQTIPLKDEMQIEFANEKFIFYE